MWIARVRVDMMRRMVTPMVRRLNEERETLMLKNQFLIIVLAITSIAVTPGCKETSTQAKSEPAAQAKSESTAQVKSEPTTQAKSEPTTQGKAHLSSEALAHVESILGDYEALRAALAGDRISDVSSIAIRLEQSIKTSKVQMPEAIKNHLDSVGLTATKLKTIKSADDIRAAFGELSRPVVTLLTEQSTLARGRYVFKCPMAKGYQKWVQTSEKLENPYMGGRMLQCGYAVKFNAE